MKVYEFGDKNKPVIMLLPGTMCYRKGNFGGVIAGLSEDFLVAAVSYTGFDENDSEDYNSVIDETEKIERYVKKHYNGKILAIYGCSLGGTFAAQLAARHKIHITKLPTQIDNEKRKFTCFMREKWGISI